MSEPDDQHGPVSTRTADAARDPHHADRADLELAGGVRFRTKPGVRGFPGAPPGADELTPYLRDAIANLGEDACLLDASGSAGAVAGAVAAAGGSVRVSVLEPSAAALTCASEILPADHVHAGWIGDAAAPEPGWDLIALAPPADLGTARVHAELAAAARALRDDGVAFVALHKDRGGKRYVKDAAMWFSQVDTVGRQRGWRVARLGLPRRAAPVAARWTRFEVAGRPFEALPGVFAAGKLDPGTRVLLHALAERGALERSKGERVLDLGCGTGVLGTTAAAAGAEVVAVDDDFLAVRSTQRSAALQEVALYAVHSDLDARLRWDDAFQIVLCNPPFHVGTQVRLDVSQAFARAAQRRLVAGGELWLVANRALPYERWLDRWAHVETVADRDGFKVLRAVRQAS